MSQPIIKRSRVQVAESTSANAAAPVQLVHSPGHSNAHGQKTVRMLDEGGRVRAIELTCTCGDVTAIELIYPDDQA
jgi:hypothetical protein